MIEGRVAEAFKALWQGSVDAPEKISLLTAGGLGFEINVPSPSLRQALLANDRSCTLFVAQMIREDSELMFGFETLVERELFVELCELDKVGPKTAAAALTAIGADGLRRYVETGTMSVAKVPGFGPASLQKLKDGLKKSEKLKKLWNRGLERTPTTQKQFGSAGLSVGVRQVLAQLGLKPYEMDKLYMELEAEDANIAQASSNDLVKKVLQRWSAFRHSQVDV